MGPVELDWRAPDEYLPVADVDAEPAVGADSSRLVVPLSSAVYVEVKWLAARAAGGVWKDAARCAAPEKLIRISANVILREQRQTRQHLPRIVMAHVDVGVTNLTAIICRPLFRMEEQIAELLTLELDKFVGREPLRGLEPAAIQDRPAPQDAFVNRKNYVTGNGRKHSDVDSGIQT